MHLLPFSAVPIVETRTPCVPSPCGANAICREQNGAGSCSCLPEYLGNPYEGCRPECVLNSDCPSNKACIRNKCIDPCPGTCGQNANCQVINHLPSCTCIPGYTGDPFRFCNLPPPERKKHIFYQKPCLRLPKFLCSCHAGSAQKPLQSIALWTKQPMQTSKWPSCLFLFAKLYR